MGCYWVVLVGLAFLAALTVWAPYRRDRGRVTRAGRGPVPVPARGDDVARAADAVHDLLTMLGIDPDERPDDHNGPSTAEVLASAALNGAGHGALRAALEPFAAAADIYDHRSSSRRCDGTGYMWEWDDGEHAVKAGLVVGDLRRARRTLQAPTRTQSTTGTGAHPRGGRR